MSSPPCPRRAGRAGEDRGEIRIVDEVRHARVTTRLARRFGMRAGRRARASAARSIARGHRKRERRRRVRSRGDSGCHRGNVAGRECHGRHDPIAHATNRRGRDAPRRARVVRCRVGSGPARLECPVARRARAPKGRSRSRPRALGPTSPHRPPLPLRPPNERDARALFGEPRALRSGADSLHTSSARAISSNRTRASAGRGTPAARDTCEACSPSSDRATARIAPLRARATRARPRPSRRASAHAATARASAECLVSSRAMRANAERIARSSACSACQRARSAANVSRTHPSTAFSLAIASTLRVARAFPVRLADAEPRLPCARANSRHHRRVSHLLVARRPRRRAHQPNGGAVRRELRRETLERPHRRRLLARHRREERAERSRRPHLRPAAHAPRSSPPLNEEIARACELGDRPRGRHVLRRFTRTPDRDHSDVAAESRIGDRRAVGLRLDHEAPLRRQPLREPARFDQIAEIGVRHRVEIRQRRPVENEKRRRTIRNVRHRRTVGAAVGQKAPRVVRRARVNACGRVRVSHARIERRRRSIAVRSASRRDDGNRRRGKQREVKRRLDSTSFSLDRRPSHRASGLHHSLAQRVTSGDALEHTQPLSSTPPAR